MALIATEEQLLCRMLGVGGLDEATGTTPSKTNHGKLPIVPRGSPWHSVENCENQDLWPTEIRQGIGFHVFLQFVFAFRIGKARPPKAPLEEENRPKPFWWRGPHTNPCYVQGGIPARTPADSAITTK